MAASFSSNDKSVIDRELRLPAVPLVAGEEEEVQEVFEVDRCSAWIQSTGCTRVALQFPDYLLGSAARVAAALKACVSHEVFVLGDTSYGECCVDEVAAQHLNADAVIHFGHTCLTPPQHLPVLYVYTRQKLNLGSLISSIRNKFSENDNLLVLYDVEFDYALKDLVLKDWKGNVCVGVPCPPSSPLEEGWITKFGRRFKTGSWEELAESRVIFVSTAGTNIKLMNFMFSFARSDFYVYEEEALVPANISINKLLMKRYFLVEKTKDAERIGILVGTLGAASYSTVIERLREMIKKRGKKCYTFLVGKPNAAKLANFPEIDVFVLVACPETSFPDTSDYFQSVITPYELEMACNPSREWGGQYLTDFRDLLPGGSGYVEASDKTEDVPDISLVSGRIRGPTLSTGEDSGDLVVINNRTVSLLHSGGGGEFLAARSWSGLEQKLGECQVGDVLQGQTGVAAGYSGEPVL